MRLVANSSILASRNKTTDAKTWPQAKFLFEQGWQPAV